MKAKITRKGGYSCAPNGHTVEHFDKGTIVEGQVAEWAVKDGAAKADKMTAAEKKAEKARVAAEDKVNAEAAEAEAEASEDDQAGEGGEDSATDDTGSESDEDGDAT